MLDPYQADPGRRLEAGRDLDQVGRAAAAIAAAETGQGRPRVGKPVQGPEQGAFRAAGAGVDGDDPAGGGQTVDVPMRFLLRS